RRRCRRGPARRAPRRPLRSAVRRRLGMPRHYDTVRLVTDHSASAPARRVRPRRAERGPPGGPPPGADPAPAAARRSAMPVDPPARWDLEVDLVSVGSGLGGVSAAIAAHDRGLRTAILDKAPRLGGVSGFGGGEVF